MGQLAETSHNYSQLSTNGHSSKRTALLTDTFFQFPILLSSQTLYLHIPLSIHSRERTRAFWKLKLEFAIAYTLS